MYHQYREGYIEVICGCMFAGKTEELIRRINVLSYAKQKILVFKPKIDDRYSEIEIASHSGRKVPCFAIDDPEEILDKVTDDVQVVAIDEVQFFDDNIVDVAIDLADQGIRVIENIFNQNVRILPDKNYCDNYLASQQVNSFINIFFKL